MPEGGGPVGMEWVPGDRGWTRVFLGLHIVLFGLAALFLAMIGAAALAVTGAIAASPFSVDGDLGLGPLEEPVVLGGMLAIFAMTLWLRQTRPIAQFVGFSADGLGVRYALGIFEVTVPWSDLRWTDRRHLRLRTGSGSLRLVLTTEQSERILRYLAHTGAELPAETRGGQRFTA